MLVDADVYGGATAQMLAVLDEVSGVLAAARSASTGSLDDVGLAESARQVAPRLRVLTGLPRADRWTALRPAAVREVLSRARRRPGWWSSTAVSASSRTRSCRSTPPHPRRNGATVTAVLEDADLVVVVGSADPLGLARLARARYELREAVPAAQVRLVVNRVRSGLGWSRDDVSRTLLHAIGEVPLGYLPLDQPAVDACWVTGRTLPEAAPQSALAGATAELSAAVGGEVGLHRDTSGPPALLATALTRPRDQALSGPLQRAVASIAALRCHLSRCLSTQHGPDRARCCVGTSLRHSGRSSRPDRSAHLVARGIAATRQSISARPHISGSVPTRSRRSTQRCASHEGPDRAR